MGFRSEKAVAVRFRPGIPLSVLVCVLGAMAPGLTGCNSDRPARENNLDGSGTSATDGGSGDTPISSAVAAGLDPATTSSTRYCDALRAAVSDATFDAPIATVDVIDYEPGRSTSSFLVSCELGTDDIQTSSHPSGGGTFQRGVARLAISGGPFEKDGSPSSRPASEWVDSSSGECRGEDGSFFGTAATTVFCLDDTAHGFTTAYFDDGILTLDMQAPQLLTTEFTLEKYVAARDAIFNALSQ